VPSVKVIDIVRRAEYILMDSGVRWPRVELQNWINEAYMSIVLIRPDANAKAGTFTCAAGTRQDLTAQFPTALRILDVTRNLAATSSKKVVRLVERGDLDDQMPDWHGHTATVNIQFWAYDARQPKQFFVYPPALDTAELEMVYSDAPGTHALTEGDLDPDGANTEVIKLDDIYMSPIVDWVLYRAYSKDAENAANEARANAALQSFQMAIGAKSQSDTASAPHNASTVT